MTAPEGVPCMIMRGGSSKGAYFVADDLPGDTAQRDSFLLEMMGSPDARQIDGIGGAHPLTSKVAIVARSRDARADIEYLFLQLGVDEATVSDRQNCGNLLAGVGPFAVERGLISATDGDVEMRILMLNTDSVASASFRVESGVPVYSGDVAISGVPGTAAPIHLNFEDIAGSSCGALLPTGNYVDVVEGIECTLIDNGMPVVVMAATDLDITGYEDCADLEANEALRTQLETIRTEAGQLMGLGDVAATSIPKLTMVAPAQDGGNICTRTFIPHRCHDAIGVLGAVSVATAALLPDTPANGVLTGGDRGTITIEHPTGSFDAAIEIRLDGESPRTPRAGIIRTARKLMDGTVFGRSA